MNRTCILTLGAAAIFAACNAARVPPQSSWAATLPVLVNAGADFQARTGAPACLDASSTYHPLGTSYFLTWRQTAGAVVSLDDSGSRYPCFVAPLSEQTLTFELTANDTLWSTTDQVQVMLRQDPNAFAPSVRGGPDRFVGNNESQTPNGSDVAAADPNVHVVWEVLVPTAVPNPSSQVILASAALLRLTGHTEDGLDALPDYVLLWPYDSSVGNRHGPTAVLTGPEAVSAGGAILLDASKSSDGSGDPLRWRWVQTCGTGASLWVDPGSVQQASLSAAMRPERQCFRISVRDSLLESAPADLDVTVGLPAGHASPVLVPESFSTHAANTVVLNADPNGQNPNSVRYTWQQTLGPAVNPNGSAADANRRLFFVAPAADANTPLAFAVSASDGVVDSGPAVAVLQVVDNANNAAPQITLCATSLSPDAGSPVTLYASAADPEQDALNPNLTGSTEPAGSATVSPETAGPRPAACPLPGSRSGLPPQAYQASFTAPASGTQFSVSVQICDSLGACGNASLAMQVP